MSLWDPIMDGYHVKTDPSYLERRIELCLIFFLGLLFLQFSVGAFQIFLITNLSQHPLYQKS